MALKSIQPARRRLADQVYDQLVQAFVSGQITYDDHLVQERLAAELQISRTPVREALMRLEQEGVLEVSSRGSFKLYRMSNSEVRELYQARAAIEGQAIRILTERCAQSDMDALRATIEEEEEIANPSPRAYFEANRTIHRKFLELANNRFLLEMFDMIWGKAMAFHLFSAIEHADLTKSLGDHIVLVDVIAAKDKTRALDVMTSHIQDGFDLQLEGLKGV